MSVIHQLFHPWYLLGARAGSFVRGVPEHQHEIPDLPSEAARSMLLIDPVAKSEDAARRLLDELWEIFCRTVARSAAGSDILDPYG